MSFLKVLLGQNCPDKFPVSVAMRQTTRGYRYTFQRPPGLRDFEKDETIVLDADLWNPQKPWVPASVLEGIKMLVWLPALESLRTVPLCTRTEGHNPKAL
jgi:hypothetical protein